MNLFIHDIACAIERDATTDPSFERSRGSRAAWLAEWVPRFEEASAARDEEDSSRADSAS
ncbi:MAG: hypothetical protein JWM86_1590 [Thermoleophilia bacterium]|nr:hypothetical protein [Thermoleophilia bacterium]